MKHSQLFTKSSKSVPTDETAINAQLLIKAGFIDKQMAGVYTYLPMGLLVLNNIIQIIREEMDKAGGNEISMTALQPKDLWEATGRWDDKVMDDWFKTKLANGSEIGLATTHEEPLTDMMKRFINSYKDLPVYIYQFQTKFRNELRSKSGLMRGREFLMKDLYSFSRDQQEHQKFYDVMTDAYINIFDKLGIGKITYKTLASGGSFSKSSDEFQTVSKVGEDTIYVDESKKIAVNKEIISHDVLAEMGLKKDDLVEKRAVEVGNIFNLDTKYSEALGLYFTDKDGKSKPVYMGSYGMGPSRLMGILAEHFADEKGLVWHENVSPFKLYLVQIGDSKDVINECQKLYDFLGEKGISILWDDRDERPGIKFADADLYGIPNRVVISENTLKSSEYEFKKRTSEEIHMISKENLIKSLAC
jgi:prolyl-tRNA synthetase